MANTEQTNQSSTTVPVKASRSTALAPFEQSWPPAFLSSPFQVARRLEDEMDRLFNRFGGTSRPFAPFNLTPPITWAPTADLSETEEEWQLEVDLPGIKPEDVNLQIRGGALFLRAETKRDETAEDSRRYHRRERSYGLIEETFSLPPGVAEDRINAEFRHGVLVCHLPKSDEAKSESRQIPIASSQSSDSANQASAPTSADTEAQGRVDQGQA